MPTAGAGADAVQTRIDRHAPPAPPLSGLFWASAAEKPNSSPCRRKLRRNVQQK
jgi:hypothetical protein